jgi:hypothetical protein
VLLTLYEVGSVAVFGMLNLELELFVFEICQ